MSSPESLKDIMTRRLEDHRAASEREEHEQIQRDIEERNQELKR